MIRVGNVDDAGEGSEVSIPENINIDTSLDAHKGPPILEEEGYFAAEISPASDNSGSVSNNDCATEI